MKSLLTAIFALACLSVSAWAIHGGYTLGGSAAAFGTYAGVLIPTSVTTSGSATGNFGTNSLGLFTLNVPQTGFGDGVVHIFAGDRELSGNISALADPRTSGGIVGVINATALESVGTFGVIFSNGTTSSVSDNVTVATASGGITANTAFTSTSISPTGVDLAGTANLQVDEVVNPGSGLTFTGSQTNVTESIVYQVDGFQTSANPPVTSGT